MPHRRPRGGPGKDTRLPGGPVLRPALAPESPPPPLLSFRRLGVASERPPRVGFKCPLAGAGALLPRSAIRAGVAAAGGSARARSQPPSALPPLCRAGLGSSGPSAAHATSPGPADRELMGQLLAVSVAGSHELSGCYVPSLRSSAAVLHSRLHPLPPGMCPLRVGTSHTGGALRLLRAPPAPRGPRRFRSSPGSPSSGGRRQDAGMAGSAARQAELTPFAGPCGLSGKQLSPANACPGFARNNQTRIAPAGCS